MFLVRSAFWLTAAFIALHPPGVDLGATATAISGKAVAAGQQMVMEQILNNDCSLLHCAPVASHSAAPVETASAASPRIPSVDLTVEVSPTNRAAPVPRPRPAWMG